MLRKKSSEKSSRLARALAVLCRYVNRGSASHWSASLDFRSSEEVETTDLWVDTQVEIRSGDETRVLPLEGGVRHSCPTKGVAHTILKGVPCIEVI